MQNIRKLILFFSVLILISLACDLFPSDPTQDSLTYITAVAETVSARLTNEAPSTGGDFQNPPQPSVPTNTAERSALGPPIDPSSIYAPDPLGPGDTGYIFDSGACFDLDAAFPVNDATCDLYLDSNGILEPRNGAIMTGYASLSPPSLGQCMGAALTNEQLAPGTDMYFCFQTNQSLYGFFVMRFDQMFDLNRIVFDMYVFR